MKRFHWILLMAATVGVLTRGDLAADDEAPPSPADSGRILLGTGVNSDAGVIGAIRMDDEPAPPEPAADAPQVIMQGHLLRLDWNQLRSSGIDLRTITEQGRDIGLVSPAPLPAAFIVGAVDPAEAREVVSKLLDTKSAETISRPQITTIADQPGLVQVAAVPPLTTVVIEEVVNGRYQRRGETRQIGHNLRLTPTVLDDDQLAISIDAESSHVVSDPNSNASSGSPTIRSRVYRLQATVQDGQTLILSELPPESSPAGPREKHETDAEHGMMLLLTPRVVRSNASPTPPPPMPVPVPGPAKPAPAPQPAAASAAVPEPSIPAGWPSRIELRQNEIRRVKLPQWDNDTPAATAGAEGASYEPPESQQFSTMDESIVEASLWRGLLTLFGEGKGLTTLLFEGPDGSPLEIEVLVTGDTRPLEAHVRRLYPEANVSAREVGEAVILRGQPGSPEQVAGIVAVAEQFYPKVINQMEAAERNPAALAPKENSRDWATAANLEVASLGRRTELTHRVANLREAARNLRDAGLHEMAAQVTKQAEETQQKVRRMMEAAAAHASATRSGEPAAGLHDEIRELRGEVQELRRDVGRLLELLEKRTADQNADASTSDATSAQVARPVNDNELLSRPPLAGDEEQIVRRLRERAGSIAGHRTELAGPAADPSR